MCRKAQSQLLSKVCSDEAPGISNSSSSGGSHAVVRHPSQQQQDQEEEAAAAAARALQPYDQWLASDSGRSVCLPLALLPQHLQTCRLQQPQQQLQRRPQQLQTQQAGVTFTAHQWHPLRHPCPAYWLNKSSSGS